MTYPHDDTTQGIPAHPLTEEEAHSTTNPFPGEGRRNRPLRVFSLPGIGLRDTKDHMTLALEVWPDGHDKVSIRVCRKGFKKNPMPGEKRFTSSNYIKAHDLFPLAFLAQEAARWLSQYWLSQKANPLATQDEIFQFENLPPQESLDAAHNVPLPGLSPQVMPLGNTQHTLTPQSQNQSYPQTQDDEIPF